MGTRWKHGKTLVFDDSFTHAVRVRGGTRDAPEEVDGNREHATLDAALPLGKARVVLLMRGWHPELGAEERAAVRDFVRKGGEEDPENYEMLPISPGIFQQTSQ